MRCTRDILLFPLTLLTLISTVVIDVKKKTQTDQKKVVISCLDLEMT